VKRSPTIIELGRPAVPSPGFVPRVAIVVERDSDLRRTLTEYLLSLEHQVLALSTTPEPEELGRLQPDLLVIDLLCDGEPVPIETLRRMKTMLHGSAIVAMSADSHYGDTYPDEIGTLVSAVLIKPFDLDCFDSAAGLAPA
jgi:CheY-like chemotaxis protein